jgi:hypothetical protein
MLSCTLWDYDEMLTHLLSKQTFLWIEKWFKDNHKEVFDEAVEHYANAKGQRTVGEYIALRLQAWWRQSNNVDTKKCKGVRGVGPAGSEHPSVSLKWTDFRARGEVSTVPTRYNMSKA